MLTSAYQVQVTAFGVDLPLLNRRLNFSELKHNNFVLLIPIRMILRHNLQRLIVPVLRDQIPRALRQEPQSTNLESARSDLERLGASWGDAKISSTLIGECRMLSRPQSCCRSSRRCCR